MSAAKMKQITVMAAACALLAFPVGAETVKYMADMNASSEVPPNDSTATGTADVTIDTDAKTVSWKVNYDNLTGDALAAHIHGPASDSENAPPMVTLDPIMDGSGAITDEQITAIQDGKAYVNVHTDKNPDGEIRGQLMKGE